METADQKAPPVPRLGCTASAALLVWSGSLVPGDKVPLSYGLLPRGESRFAAAPTVLEPAEGDERAGVASDGRDFLVTWRNFDYAGRRTVVGLRVDGAGQRLDDRPFAIGNSNSGNRVSVVWDGSVYQVFAIHTQNDNPFELRGRRVSRAGEGLDHDWIALGYLARPWSDSGTGSAAVGVAPGQSLIVYDQFPDDDATSNVRVRARLVQSAPPPDAGPPDAGTAPDGGAAPDAGAPPAPAPSSGCSCDVTGRHLPSTSAWLVMLSALLLGVRRRQHRLCSARHSRSA
jgi:MYXO-CTERM domain-containing protein